jgi:hypothetical protein
VSALPDLMRRIDRKLDIQRGLSLSYDDLALLVASGAYAKLRQSVEDEEVADERPLIPAGCEGDPLVYFIQAGNSGPIKIGRTKNAQQRKHHLQLATHHDLTLLAAFKAPFWAEGQLHHFYTQERIRGEWYRPSPRLLRYIEELTA